MKNVNVYSQEWYATFLDSIPAESTRTEVSFVERRLPVDAYPAILDLGCGPGRHASALARLGHRVLGVDVSESAIRRARAACPEATFEVRDMRDLRSLHGSFDGVVSLWHSFGYFDDDTNLDVLRQVRGALRPGGRAILDLYNRDHLEGRAAEQTVERGGRRVRTTRGWNGSRQAVALEYPGGGRDEFEWRLYSPEELLKEHPLEK